jgi:hypothetical protein
LAGKDGKAVERRIIYQEVLAEAAAENDLAGKKGDRRIEALRKCIEGFVL